MGMAVMIEVDVADCPMQELFVCQAEGRPMEVYHVVLP